MPARCLCKTSDGWRAQCRPPRRRKRDRRLWAVVSMKVGHLPSGPPPVRKPTDTGRQPAAQSLRLPLALDAPSTRKHRVVGSCCDCLLASDLHTEDGLWIGVIASDDLFAVVIGSFDQGFLCAFEDQKRVLCNPRDVRSFPSTIAPARVPHGIDLVFKPLRQCFWIKPS